MKTFVLFCFLVIPYLAVAEVMSLDELYSDENQVNQVYGEEEDYEKREYLGFDIYIKLDILDSQKKKAEAAYSLISSQLFQMQLLLPVKVMEKLVAEKVKIVINDECGDGECSKSYGMCHSACYIPYIPFLHEFKSKAVVYRDLERILRNFRKNNSVLLHEFGHAFHNLIVPDGFDNQTIIDAWELAVYSRKFEKVNYITNRLDGELSKVEHYLLTNELEYFAEVSAALWLRSVFEPFVYHQVYVDEMLTNRTTKQNPIWDAWWDHSGPHERGRTWYWQTLDEGNYSVDTNAPDIPSLFDLDHKHE